MESDMLEMQKQEESKIFAQAQTLYNNARKSGRHPSWSDYESLKKQLHANGIFGKEYQLANILHI